MSDEPMIGTDAPEVDDGPELEVEVEHDEEILASQERISKALDRARAGEDRALATAVREDGERFVRVFFGLLRMLRLHDLQNEAFSKPIGELVEITAGLYKLLGAINLVTVEEQVYINDIRIRFDERSESGRLMGAELLRHRIGGLTVHQPLSFDDIRVIVEVFAQEPDEDTPRTAIVNALRGRGVDSIELFGVFRFRVSDEQSDDTVGTRATSTEEEVVVMVDRGADLVEDSLASLGANRTPNPIPMRRIVTDILKGGAGAEGLWEEPGVGNEFGTHTLRVSRLSLVVGSALGLSEEALQDLGVAAMFHDMGYAAREGAVAAKDGGEAVQGYPPPFERHPAAGARLLLRQRGFHPAKIQRILSTLEHHEDYAGEHRTPSLFARIIRIAEDFDNLIRSNGGGLTAAEALRRMTPHAGTRYDPTLIQLFVNAMGKYPPGSMLLLEDGTIAVSVGNARGPDSFDKPLVRVIRDASGAVVEEERHVDLLEEGRIRMVLNSRPEALQR